MFDSNNILETHNPMWTVQYEVVNRKMVGDTRLTAP